MSKTPLTYWELARSGAGAKKLFGDSGQRGFLVPEDYHYVSIGERSCRINIHARCLSGYLTLERMASRVGESYWIARPAWPYVAKPYKQETSTVDNMFVPRNSESFLALSNTLCRGVYIHSDSIRSVDRWMAFMPNVYTEGSTREFDNPVKTGSYDWSVAVTNPYYGAPLNICVGSARSNESSIYEITNRRLMFNFWAPRSLNIMCFPKNQPINLGSPLKPQYQDAVGFEGGGMDISQWDNLGDINDSHTMRVYWTLNSITQGGGANPIATDGPYLREWIDSEINYYLDYMFEVKLWRDIP